MSKTFSVNKYFMFSYQAIKQGFCSERERERNPAWGEFVRRKYNNSDGLFYVSTWLGHRNTILRRAPASLKSSVDHPSLSPELTMETAVTDTANQNAMRILGWQGPRDDLSYQSHGSHSCHDRQQSQSNNQTTLTCRDRPMTFTGWSWGS